MRDFVNGSDILISVIMGVRYLRSDTALLHRAVSSILSQTYQNFELIICDNGSNEKARSLLAEFAINDHRVILLDGSDTSSFSEQLNRCFFAASGSYIARMDDDDYSFPERFQVQLDFLKSHDEYAFVGCQCLLECDGESSGMTSYPTEPQVRDFLFSQPFIHPSLMFRREALERIGGYSELPRCNRCEDYDLLLRLYENKLSGFNIQTPYFQYTLPPKGITTRTLKDRINESKTRFVRFRALKLMPAALPYAVKPIATAMIPARLLAAIKMHRISSVK